MADWSRPNICGIWIDWFLCVCVCCMDKFWRQNLLLWYRTISLVNSFHLSLQMRHVLIYILNKKFLSVVKYFVIQSTSADVLSGVLRTICPPNCMLWGSAVVASRPLWHLSLSLFPAPLFYSLYTLSAMFFFCTVCCQVSRMLLWHDIQIYGITSKFFATPTFIFPLPKDFTSLFVKLSLFLFVFYNFF